MHVTKRSILLFFFCTSISICGIAFADDESKLRKLQKLVRVAGIQESIHEQIMQLKQQNKTIAERMTLDTKSQFPGYPVSFYSHMEKEILFFLNSLDAYLNAPELTNKYADIFSKQVTEDELEELIEFYKSPIGKTAVIASRNATLEWTQLLLNEYQTILAKESQIYFRKMHDIGKNYDKTQ